MKTIFLCFFCLFTIGCTHQSSQENCVEIGSADSICLQKELYTLHKYVDSFESFQSAFKKEIVDSPLLEFNIMTDITMDIEIIPTTETKQPSHTTSFVLQPTPRNIPTGEAISSALLSMKTEYDYYPLSTTSNNGKHCRPTPLLKM